jgi:guanyl-specific ribonuclease Sa
MLRRIIVLRLLARARLSRSSFTEASTVTATEAAARGLTVTDRDATRSRGHGAGTTVPAAESLSGSDPSHARVQVLSPRHGGPSA